MVNLSTPSSNKLKNKKTRLVTNLFYDPYDKKKKMSYIDYLQQKIKELESNITNNVGQVDALREELKKLQMQEFEEDLRESDSQQVLLKG
jgi:predicted RNase H-like nuclease (RuvC/YqgF family)